MAYTTQPRARVARNHGLQHATGEYIYFMDSDDILDTTALQHCYDTCESKSLDFVFFDAEKIMETSAYLPGYNRKDKISDKIWKGTELLEYELEQYIFSASCCLCFTVIHSFRNISMDSLQVSFMKIIFL